MAAFSGSAPDLLPPRPPLEAQETDFDVYTFRAPRPGFFVGDSRSPDGGPNPVRLFRLDDDPDDDAIPACRPLPPFLGQLDRFPAEVLNQVLEETTPAGLVAFRRVNTRARDFVDELRDFRQVVAFPRLLAAAALLQCDGYGIRDLAKVAVVDIACVRCGHFGDVLYLIVPCRFCYYCFLNPGEPFAMKMLEPRLRLGDPTTSQTGREESKETDTTFVQNPSAVLLPGSYGDSNLLVNKPCKVALKRNHLRHRRLVEPQRNPTKLMGWGNRRPPVPWPFGSRRPYGGVAENGDGDDGSYMVVRPDSEIDWRYLAVVQAPYLEADGRYEEGFMCRACGELNLDAAEVGRVLYPAPWEWDPWRRYTREGMRRHVAERGGVYYSVGGAYLVHKYPRPPIPPDSYHPFLDTMSRMRDVLVRCRDRMIEIPQLATYMYSWSDVDGPEWVPRCERHHAHVFQCVECN